MEEYQLNDSMFLDDTCGVDGKKRTAESLEIDPKVEETMKVVKLFGVDMKFIKLFGVDIQVFTDSFESCTTIVHNLVPLRCFNPKTGRFFVQGQPIDSPDQHVENIDQPQPAVDNFARLVQDIEDEYGSRPVRMFQKNLTESDVSSNLNRLFITKSKPLMRFLREDERRRVEHTNKNVWLEVLATDPGGDRYELHLKTWPSVHIVVLNGKDWKKMISKNRLKEGSLLQIWAYRGPDAELRFAMNFNNVE